MSEELTMGSKAGRWVVGSFAAASFAILIALVVNAKFVSINTEGHKLFDGECEITSASGNAPYFINRFCTRSLDAIHVMLPLAAATAGFSLITMANLLRGKAEKTGLFHSPAILMIICFSLTIASFFTWSNARPHVVFHMDDGTYKPQADIKDGDMYAYSIAAMVLTAVTFVFWILHFSFLDTYGERIMAATSNALGRRKDRKTMPTGTGF